MTSSSTSLRRSRTPLAAVLTAALAALLGGCASLDYYRQALGGQLEIWRAQRPIAALLADEHLEPALRARLTQALAIREFASAELALPDNDSYREYADLGREFVVWNVFATPALSIEPIESCYPFLGCLSYRGFFSATDAARWADALRATGHDVFVGGVAAYSTLGWFDDPVLSTMLKRDDARLAELIFHELAHQRLYATDDTTFNESFAMAVADAGVARWLAEDPAALHRYRTERAREDALVELVLRYRERLARVFGEAHDDRTKRAAKLEVYAALRAEYAALRAGWDDDDAFDAWMAQDLNNAKLASVSTYHRRVGAFRALLEQNGREFARFYAACARIAELAAPLRARCLDGLEAGEVEPPACAAPEEQGP